MQPAINLYTVRELTEPLRRTIERTAEAGYVGVQLSVGVLDVPPESAAGTIADLGLDAIPFHIGIDALEADLSAAAETCHSLDCDGVVVPSLPESCFSSRDSVDETAARLDELADGLASHGLALHYHNHTHEFVDLDDRTAFEVLVKRTDAVRFELDVGWVAAGGLDPAALVGSVGGRCDHVHFKDVALETDTPVEIGTGDVDMAACASAAREAGVDWAIYEHDHPDDPAASLQHGAEYVLGLADGWRRH